MNKAHARQANCPRYYNERKEDLRSQAFEEDVGERLDERIRNKEYSQSDVVLHIRHVEVLFHSVYLGIADVGPVQEGYQIKQ